MPGACLLAAVLAFTETHADTAYSTASNFVASCTPRDAGTPQGRKAADWLCHRVKTLGVDVRRDDFTALSVATNGTTQMRRFTNVYVPFERDPAAPWIVLLSHFDTKPGVKCPGANDGASTTGLLVALCEALKKRSESRGPNVLLAWLDGEECIARYGEHDGFWGSQRAATMLRKINRKVDAVICLDMLGDRDLGITIPKNGTEKLATRVLAAAKRVGVNVTRSDYHVLDDHVAFLNAGYSAVDLIDFDYGSAPGKNDWWHTPEDTMDKVSRDSLLKVGRLVVAILEEPQP